MRIRRMVLVLTMALLAVGALDGPASAGPFGEPEPMPRWLEISLVVALLVVGAFFFSVVASGIAMRRRHR